MVLLQNIILIGNQTGTGLQPMAHIGDKTSGPVYTTSAA